MTAPQRVQRRRGKGSKLPRNTIIATRPGKYGNPFRVGGYFLIGKGAGHPGFIWLQARSDVADSRFTKVETIEQSVAMYRTYRERYPLTPAEVAELRGKNIACWCKVGDPCHGDILLELANRPE